MTLLRDTTEEARRRFEELQTTSENKIAALYALQVEKDEEVIPSFYFLTQITNARNTRRELEDQLSNLKVQSLAMETDSKRLTVQVQQETDLKVYPLNSQLKSDHGGTRRMRTDHSSTPEKAGSRRIKQSQNQREKRHRLP